MSRADVVLLPGFGGAAEQPILVKFSTRLEALGFSCRRRAPKRGKLTPGLELETAWLSKVLAEVPGPHVVVGRSFGGRVCVRLGKRELVSACVLLGFPVRPPGKPRPLDEAALLEVTVPTLIVQGDDDELGPLKVLDRLVKRNRLLELHVLEGAGHSFGRQEAAALEYAAAWADRVLRGK